MALERVTKKVADLKLQIRTVENNDGLRTKVQIRFLKKNKNGLFSSTFGIYNKIF